ncbi:hypothetical protein HK105_206773 [Polyrhizophydium stewartii]|uniref:Thioredoxin-like protein n=1 Tax=Polyrhizophydium stewartii TaxID=2732419 RepID=A0ABR4N2N2_9FUNG
MSHATTTASASTASAAAGAGASIGEAGVFRLVSESVCVEGIGADWLADLDAGVRGSAAFIDKAPRPSTSQPSLFSSLLGSLFGSSTPGKLSADADTDNTAGPQGSGGEPATPAAKFSSYRDAQGDSDDELERQAQGRDANAEADGADAADDDDDELLKELEEEDDDDMIASLRERRMDELRSEIVRRREMEQTRHGKYETISTEKEILKITTTTPKCLVHFSHKDFRRCQIMDRHLNDLAHKHFKTRFLKIDVADAPFLVEKLKIRVLPCLMAFVDGVSVDKLLGFEGVANKDDFTTAALERRLAEGSKVIELAEPKQAGRRTILGFADTPRDGDDDSDDD